MRLSTLSILCLLACTPVVPLPPAPDCDAGVPPPEAPRPCIQDAGHDAAKPDAGPVSACAAACEVISVICQAKQPATCEASLTKSDAKQMIRRPDGYPMTCAKVLLALDKPGLVAAGVPCP